jgi:hypothetical protein
VLFALVANRALDPSSKLAAAHWAGRKAQIDQLPATADDACYRAMDWLHDVRHALERQVFSQVAAALDLEVDLLFFDPTYFELDEEDEPVPRDDDGSPAPGGEQKGEQHNDLLQLAKANGCHGMKLPQGRHRGILAGQRRNIPPMYLPWSSAPTRGHHAAGFIGVRLDC